MPAWSRPADPTNTKVGLVSLELAQMNDPATDWATIYEAALESVARAWAA